MKTIFNLFAVFILTLTLNAIPIRKILPEEVDISIFRGNTALAGYNTPLFFYPKSKYVMMIFTDGGLELAEGNYKIVNHRLILRPQNIKHFVKISDNDYCEVCDRRCTSVCPETLSSKSKKQEYTFFCNLFRKGVEFQAELNCVTEYKIPESMKVSTDSSSCLLEDYYCKRTSAAICQETRNCRVRLKGRTMIVRQNFSRSDPKAIFQWGQ